VRRVDREDRDAPSLLVVPRLLLIVLALCAACDPDAWSPGAERERAERRRVETLAAHLETLPGIEQASVMVTPPRASVVLALEPGAAAPDPDAIRRAVTAAIDGVDPAAIEIAAAGPPPRDPVVSVGPFEVAAGSRGPLIATLAGGLVVIAGLAGWIALVGVRRYRRGISPQ
jgi:hypothetical protein